MTDNTRRYTDDPLIQEHLAVDHHPPMASMFPGVNPEEVVRNVVAMSSTVPGLLDVVYGPPKKDPVTGHELTAGEGNVIRDEEKGLRFQIANGGLRTTVKLTKPQWTAIITTVGLIVTTIIQGLFK